jgi:hypothetical protein
MAKLVKASFAVNRTKVWVFERVKEAEATLLHGGRAGGAEIGQNEENTEDEIDGGE